MAHVVFLRGVNVGRNKRFQPAALARELPFDVVNVGAAGTFVVRKSVSQAVLREAILRKLPFEADVVICRAADLRALPDESPLPGESAETQRFVSVLSRRPRAVPALPISHPDGRVWQVRVVAVTGPFAVSLWRRIGDRPLYPNEVVEKLFGVRSTTRNWNTIGAIRKVGVS